MALLPMEPPTTTHDRTDQTGFSSGERQETMFDESTAIAAPDTDDAIYAETDDTLSETFFEPDEVFADEIPELNSYRSAPDQPSLDSSVEEMPSVEPIAEPEQQESGEEPVQQALLEASAPSEAAQDQPPTAESIPKAGIAAEPAADSAPSMLTANDFAALEERVLRAVTLVRSERQARLAAEERVVAMEAQLKSFEAQIQQIEAQSPILDRLVQEVESLRLEREQVRQRVERLLGQLDALEL